MARKSFVSGAVILMLAGLIVRVFGFLFRIYLSNLIGAEGMGLFQLISPVYMLVILTLTAGISIAVSKMVSEQQALGHPSNLRRITGCALLVVVTGGVIVSLLLYFNLDYIVNEILKDGRTYYSVLLLIPCIPVIAAAAALKGYFYGIQNVVPTAYSQIVEQIVKIGLVLATAGHFVKLGLEYACAIATAGMAFGEIANLLTLYIVYVYKKKKEQKGIPRTGMLRKRKIIRTLLEISVPISINRFITSVMSAFENILIPRMLVAGGMAYTASIQLYGKLSGMAMSLIFFPSLVTMSLAITLVPAISEAVSLKNFRTVNNRISRSIQISMVMGFIFTAVFLSYHNEISALIFRKDNIGELLYLLSFTCVLIYLFQTLTGVLNGLGKQGILLRNSVAGSVVRIAAVYFAVPVYGIKSYMWGMFISFALMCGLNLHTVIKATGLAADLRNWLLKPGAVCVFMVIASRYIYHFFCIFTTDKSMIAALAVLANCFIGFFLMMLIGVLRPDEVRNMTGLKKRRKSLKH